MPTLESILLVDDSLRDTEMALHAMRGSNLAPQAVALRDGAETPGNVFWCRSFAGHASSLAILNEPSLGGGRRQGRA